MPVQIGELETEIVGEAPAEGGGGQVAEREWAARQRHRLLETRLRRDGARIRAEGFSD